MNTAVLAEGPHVERLGTRTMAGTQARLVSWRALPAGAAGVATLPLLFLRFGVGSGLPSAWANRGAVPPPSDEIWSFA
ncbi:hypothetical protein WKW80_31855 [Variovorax humicola]|uniref:Uncharacterized protein n=1 Tax=Variovorax humicola TaxID=1769758 RepID=A0ABU8WAJ0_9BURK